jgi:polyisoprenoid-binding protein YceI
MKKYLPILLLAGALIVSACKTDKKIEDISVLPQRQTPIAMGSYIIDSESSQINWHAEKIIGSGHNGTVKIKSGAVFISESSNQGSIMIDMTTIKDNENTEPLIKHLKSSDFFDVDKFPESQIELTKITPKTGELNKYEISGNLTIKDKTNPITFEAESTNVGDTINLTGEFSIDRTLWDIRFGSNKFFENLGDKAISDNIDYNISIVAKLKK